MTITTCGDRQPIKVAARGKHLVVDIHCHLGIPAADAIVQARHPGPPPQKNWVSCCSSIRWASLMPTG